MNQRIVLTGLLLASTSGLACAQSTVTIYGVMDAVAGRFTGAATGVNSLDKPVWSVNGGGLSTSHIGFRGTEDLGDGYFAGFDLSAFIRNDTGAIGRSDGIGAPVNVAADPFFSRSSWVSLSSKDYGRIRFGNVTTLLFLNSITTNAFGDSTVFGPLNLVTHIGTPQAGGTGWANVVVYDSPTLAGFSIGLAKSLSEGQGGGNESARIAYAQGPFSASAVWQSVKKNPLTFADGTTSNNVSTWMVGGFYDFKPVKVYAHYGHMVNDGTETAPQNVRYRIAEISAEVRIDTGVLLAGYALRKTSDSPAPVPATVAGGSIERQVASVGYDYFLSRRTDVYAMLMHDRTRTLTLPPPFLQVSASGTSYGLGMRHRF